MSERITFYDSAKRFHFFETGQAMAHFTLPGSWGEASIDLWRFPKCWVWRERPGFDTTGETRVLTNEQAVMILIATNHNIPEDLHRIAASMNIAGLPPSRPGGISPHILTVYESETDEPFILDESEAQRWVDPKPGDLRMARLYRLRNGRWLFCWERLRASSWDTLFNEMEERAVVDWFVVRRLPFPQEIIHYLKEKDLGRTKRAAGNPSGDVERYGPVGDRENGIQTLTCYPGGRWILHTGPGYCSLPAHAPLTPFEATQWFLSNGMTVPPTLYSFIPAPGHSSPDSQPEPYQPRKEIPLQDDESCDFDPFEDEPKPQVMPSAASLKPPSGDDPLTKPPDPYPVRVDQPPGQPVPVYLVPSPSGKEQPGARLSIINGQVFVDAKLIPLKQTSNKAEDTLDFLQVLLDVRGNFLSSAEIGRTCKKEGTRFDRVYRDLPPEIKVLIIARRNQGFCLA